MKQESVWRLLLHVAVAFALAVAGWNSVFLAGETIFGGAHTDYLFARHLFHAVLMSVLIVPALLALSRLLDGAALPELSPLHPFKAVKAFAVGCAAWIVPAALAIGVLLASGTVQIVPAQHATELLRFLPVQLLLVLFYEALPEELIFRGYIYRHLSAGMPRLAAVIGQAALFCVWGIAIGAATSPDRLLLFFAFALLQGGLRVIAGTVWAPIGLHVAFQTTAQFMFGGTNDRFVVSDAETLQLFAFGVAPFALVILIAGLFYRGPYGWMQVVRKPADSASA